MLGHRVTESKRENWKFAWGFPLVGWVMTFSDEVKNTWKIHSHDIVIDLDKNEL